MNKALQFSNMLRPVGYGLFGKKTRLAMNYMLYNEEDIIEANIRYHASVGVSSFVIIDNGSTDTTRDIVTELAKEFDITILDKPGDLYLQSDWKTEMAIISRRKHGAHWSIANDADEFWLSTRKKLTDVLPRMGATRYCARYNMIPRHNDFVHNTQSWYLADHMVKRPVALNPESVLHDPDVSIMLHKIHGKVMANNYGLVRIHGGNHRASHIFNPLLKENEQKVIVLHYPMQGKKRFIDIIKRMEMLLQKKSSKMGNHCRRWASLYNAGKIEEEITRLALDDAAMETLSKFGILGKLQEVIPNYTESYAHFLKTVSSIKK